MADGAPAQSSADGQGIAATRGNPELVKALGQASRCRRMLEKGQYASIRQVTAAERMDRAYVGRVLNLALLAPALVEAALGGAQPATLDPTNFKPHLRSD